MLCATVGLIFIEHHIHGFKSKVHACYYLFVITCSTSEEDNNRQLKGLDMTDYSIIQYVSLGQYVKSTNTVCSSVLLHQHICTFPNNTLTFH